MLRLSLFGVLLLACSSSARGPCTVRDVELMAHEANCLAYVGEQCADIPLDQPCPYEEQCKAYVRERCK